MFFGKQSPGWERRSLGLLLGLMLVGSLLRLFLLPAIDKGIDNAIVPLAAVGIIFLRRSILPTAFRYFRLLILFTALLAAWMWLSAALSPHRHVALAQALNYSGHLVSFVGLMVLFFQISRTTRLLYLRIAFRFLLSLALFGVLEYVYPPLPLLSFFRDPDSLKVFPRLASLMVWPNQFAVLMALNGALGLVLWRNGAIRVPLTVVALSLNIFCLANTGSRNGWMVFLFTLLGLLAFRTLRWTSVAFMVGTFLLALLSFDVPVRQLGIPENNWVPLVPQRSVDTTRPLRESDVTLRGLDLTNPIVVDRLRLWRRAAAELAQRPLTGIGTGVFEYAIGPQVMGSRGFNAHNLFLNLAVELGLVGLGLLGIWTLLLTRGVDWRDPLAVVPMIPLVAGQIIDCFTYDHTFVVVFMVFTAAFANARADQKDPFPVAILDPRVARAEECLPDTPGRRLAGRRPAQTGAHPAVGFGRAGPGNFLHRVPDQTGGFRSRVSPCSGWDRHLDRRVQD